MLDTWVMIKRSMLILFRNPESMIMAVVTPFMVMLLMGTIFGNIANIGEGINFIDFIVSGIILQALVQATQYTGIGVAGDMSKGIMDRFRSMPISRMAVLNGHATASVIKNTLSIGIMIGAAFIVGFRPQAGLVGWLGAIGIFTLFNIAFTWLTILFGLLAKSPDMVAGYVFPFIILPFVSTGFTPTELLPRGVRQFAQHQPMSPVIDATRNLMMDVPVGNSVWIALAWLVGITVFSLLMSLRLYKRKLV